MPVSMPQTSWPRFFTPSSVGLPGPFCAAACCASAVIPPIARQPMAAHNANLFIAVPLLLSACLPCLSKALSQAHVEGTCGAAHPCGHGGGKQLPLPLREGVGGRGQSPICVNLPLYGVAELGFSLSFAVGELAMDGARWVAQGVQAEVAKYGSQQRPQDQALCPPKRRDIACVEQVLR